MLTIANHTNQREAYIDIAKGLAIWCIVLLHYENGLFPASVNAGVSYFMISMFYITSGWLLGHSSKPYTFKSFARKRWQQLGKPYLWWSAIILIFDVLLFTCGWYDVKFLAQEVYKTLALRGIGTLWFLPALFLGELFWIFVWRKLRWWWQAIIALLIVSYGESYLKTIEIEQDNISRIIDAPFRTLYNASNAALNITIAVLFRQYIWPRIMQLSSISLFLIGLLTYALSYIIYSEGLLFVRLLALATAALGVLLAIYTIQHFRGISTLAFWGRNSLNLMVTHYSIVMVLWHIFITEVLHKTNEKWWALLGFVCSIPLQYALALVLNKKVPQLFGKSSHSPQHS